MVRLSEFSKCVHVGFVAFSSKRGLFVIGPTVEDFLCHKPAEFTGKASPDEANAWLRKCEKIFRVMNCEDEQKLLCATYLLNKDAEYWWTGMQQQMETRKEPATWENFRTRFLEKYFPNTVRQDREAEFLPLQQGDMSVQEYINKFEHLARYSSQNMTEEWRCLKFERGLKHELKKVVTPLRERRFPVLVEQAKSAEHLEKGPSPIVSRHQKNVAEARQMKKPYSRPQTSQGPSCYQCGGPHLKRNCSQLAGGVGGSEDHRKCFICDKSGHFTNNCLEKKSLVTKKPAASPAERARAAGRVFALTTTEATQSGNLILEPCMLFGNVVLVFFDSEATHSFISNVAWGDCNW